MKKLTILIISLLSVSCLWGQVPQGINYQTVVRNASLDPIANQEVAFRIFFNDGNPTPTAFYAETHTVTTDELGMVQLPLGGGEALFGLQFEDVDWSRVKSVQIDFDPDGGTNYTTLATLPLWSVPFAFLAQDVINKDDADADPENEIQALVFDPTTGELSLTGGNSVLIYDPEALDTDSTNEIQTLNYDPVTGELMISKGNTVTIEDAGDNDRDPTNEFQQLQYDSASGTLVISDGNMVRIPTVVAPDADADPTNELQELQMDLMTGDLMISQGNTVNVFDPNDMDKDAMNELQGLQFDAMTGDLTISQGNTVNVFDPSDLDKDPMNEIQNLEIDTMAGTLTISGGNTVELPSAGGGGSSQWIRDMDDIYYDMGNVGIGRIPDNYALEVEGTTWNAGNSGFSLLNGDGLSLNDLNGQSMAFIGMKSLPVNYYSGLAAPDMGALYLEDPINDTCCVPAVMGVNIADGSGLLELYSPTARKPNLILGSGLGCADCGAIQLFSPNGSLSVFAGSDLGTGGYVYTFGENGNFNTDLTFLSGQPNHGAVSVTNDIGLNTGLLTSSPDGGALQLGNSEGEARLFGFIEQDDFGSFFGFGPNGGSNFILSTNGSNPDWGAVGIVNDVQLQVGVMTVAGQGEGAIYTLGTNGNLNTILSSGSGQPNQGFMGIFDEMGLPRAGFFIDGNGDGSIFSDVKNFRVDHPLDKDSEIWYASLEGPEAGAYVRGEATLDNGEVFVPYPEHFALIVNSESVTVLLTPHEWDTYGLAVIEKRDNGFLVKELKGGNGNFSFDWEVKAVRKGFENFKVVRPKMEISDPSKDIDPSSVRNSSASSLKVDRAIVK